MTMSTTVRIPDELLEDVRRIGALQGRAPGEMLAQAWQDFVERHREEIAADFEQAAAHIRAGDTAALASHVGRNRRSRAEAAAAAAHTA
jgi:predicted transcriptional regulator